MKRMNKNLTGTLTVEAALIFPWVIAAILPFLYLLQMLAIQNMLEIGLEEALREIAAEAYILERTSILPAKDETEDNRQTVDEKEIQALEELKLRYTAFLEEDGWKESIKEEGVHIAGRYLLKEKLQEYFQGENLGKWGIMNGWDGISLSESEFFYTKMGRRGLIKGVISFRWKIELPFWNNPYAKICRVYHTFIGEDKAYGNESTGSTESDSQVIVYCIGAGTHYHSLGCYLIQKNVFMQLKTEAQKEGKEACQRCHAEQEMTVYSTVGGMHYHTKECSYLYPDLKPVLLDEARKRGYTGCKLCQGGEDYFS